MKVESAIQQLDLRRARYFNKHARRLNDLKEVENVKRQIQTKYQSIGKIEEDMEIVKNVEQELLAYHENLQSKDKLIEKKLQIEFPNLGKNAFAALLTQYKKRPRIVLKNTSADEGLDLGKAIVTMKKLPNLTSESLDYLRQLDNLDVRPSTLPQSIETTHWENLVVMRRLKVIKIVVTSIKRFIKNFHCYRSRSIMK